MRKYYVIEKLARGSYTNHNGHTVDTTAWQTVGSIIASRAGTALRLAARRGVTGQCRARLVKIGGGL